MYKVFIELMEAIVEITGNDIIDTLLFAIIGFVSFSFAFGLVSKIFDKLGFYDSGLMSNVHWSIRILVFLGLTYVGTKVVQLFNRLLNLNWWVHIILGIIFVGIVVLVCYFKHLFSKNKSKRINIPKETTNELMTSKQIENDAMSIDDRCYCPCCYSKLVKRYGPYGDFYGCESYGKTGCKYTRKYL